MTASVVQLDRQQRRTVCQAIVSEMLAHGVEVIAAGMDDHHFHVLAKYSDHRPKHWIGLAKRRASLALQGPSRTRGCGRLEVVPSRFAIEHTN
jgi:hypothetical protein